MINIQWNQLVRFIFQIFPVLFQLESSSNQRKQTKKESSTCSTFRETSLSLKISAYFQRSMKNSQWLFNSWRSEIPLITKVCFWLNC
ncbi:hypothetical protein FGO68_gene11423 [Halteria grandinella]|uniref:Uncharacterized protein n=1 Tax=Halteria grandinella TaxID=5974 RepID=A0A8J8T0S0_HALGN|nr:hypothetical protein FGO68_gene11423 [Halteria grandinella]